MVRAQTVNRGGQQQPNGEERKGPAQRRGENAEGGHAPGEVSRGATFPYALNMPDHAPFNAVRRLDF